MVKKVRIKFTIIGMAATLIVTVLLITAINLVNAMQTNRNLDQVLQEMASLTGPPEKERSAAGSQEEFPFPPSSESGDFPFPPEMRRGAAENQYAGRFFRVEITQTGEVLVHPFSQTLLTEEDIASLGEAVLQKGEESGYINDYRYYMQTKENGTSISFLDCTTEFAAHSRLLIISVFVGLGGLLISFFLIFLASGKIVEPLRKSMDKQKRFITDASHELKTPISVIGTNMDILSMDFGNNEWIDGTKKQVHRMRDLVNHLISLARLDESADQTEMERFNLSDAAEESVQIYLGPARIAGINMIINIEKNCFVQGNENMVRQMMGILCDNAVKYVAGRKEISIRLMKEGRKIIFETANPWDREHAPEDLNRFFDRFYRADTSRTRGSGTGGYGLGLSIAQGIAEKNHIQLSIHEDQQERLAVRAVFSGL